LTLPIDQNPHVSADEGGPPSPVTRFNRRLGDLLAYGYVVVFVLTFGEVMARYLFNAPTQWTLELCLIVAGLHYILCGPQVSANDGHIAVTTLTDTFAPRGRQVVKQIGYLVSLICCLVLIVGAWNQAAFSVEVNERSGTIFNSRLPMILKMALVAAFVLMAAEFSVKLMRSRRA
jgi:TRAP-type C4-dicarboxylate transport system permease small subunit